MIAAGKYPGHLSGSTLIFCLVHVDCPHDKNTDILHSPPIAVRFYTYLTIFRMINQVI